MLCDLQVKGHRRLHRIFEHLLVEHRQGAWQATHHRIDVGVGLIAKGRGGAGEDLAVRA